VGRSTHEGGKEGHPKKEAVGGKMGPAVNKVKKKTKGHGCLRVGTGGKWVALLGKIWKLWGEAVHERGGRETVVQVGAKAKLDEHGIQIASPREDICFSCSRSRLAVGIFEGGGRFDTTA